LLPSLHLLSKSLRFSPRVQGLWFDNCLDLWALLKYGCLHVQQGFCPITLNSVIVSMVYGVEILGGRACK
jgi:hypothetical protein